MITGLAVNTGLRLGPWRRDLFAAIVFTGPFEHGSAVHEVPVAGLVIPILGSSRHHREGCGEPCCHPGKSACCSNHGLLPDPGHSCGNRPASNSCSPASSSTGTPSSRA